MDAVDPAKRITRSQLPLPDAHLDLNRSPLKDARIAQRNYTMPDPAPDDPDTDDEILLSPGKSRHLNSQVTSNTKRSASPPPHDEYNPDATAPQDGRELKRLKRDPEESKTRDPDAGGSDVENTDTNLRSTPSHTRNHSEPVLGTAKKSAKPRSTSRQATPASPKGKGRARSVPVFPVLDLSNPPTTPWRRRARSRSPSKERDSPKLRLTFSVLASIPDEAAMPPPPSVSLPEPAMPPPSIIEPPSTPVASTTYHAVFATPMSPLTPLPETPRPLQARADFDGFPRTIGWGVDIEDVRRVEGLPATSDVFPLIAAAGSSSAQDPPAPAPEPPSAELRATAEASKPAKAPPPVQSRLPRPSVQSAAMLPPPLPVVPAATSSNAAASKKGAKKQLMGPPALPGPSSSNSNSNSTPTPSTSTAAAPLPQKNAFSVMMGSTARGTVMATRGTAARGKGKDKDKVGTGKSKTTAYTSSSSSMPPPPAPPPAPKQLPKAPIISPPLASTAGASGSKAPAAAKGKGKGKEKEKGKGKVKEEPKDDSLKDKKAPSMKAKMRPREKPKPLPLPIHVRLPEDSDGERTGASTPTGGSRPETPTFAASTAASTAIGAGMVGVQQNYVRRFSSPLSELDPDEALPVVAPAPAPAPEAEMPLVGAAAAAAPAGRPSSPLTELGHDNDDVVEAAMDDTDEGAAVPPASSSPDVFSPAGGPQLELPVVGELLALDGGAASADVEMPVVPIPIPMPATDVAMDSADASADVSMPGAPATSTPAPAPAADAASQSQSQKPKSQRVGKPRAPAPLPAPADRVTRSASLKRKEAEGGSGPATLTQKKLFFGVGPATAAHPAKKQKLMTNGGGESSTSNSTGASTSKIPIPSPTKIGSFANPTKASAAKASAAKTPAKNKPVSAAAGPSGGGGSRSPSPSKGNKLVRASSLFTARPPPSFSRAFTGPGGSTSSLQTLASALEKLRMPPPERPNTSMGFSRDDTDSTLVESTQSTRSADERSIGIGRPSGGLQRASTVASIGSASSSTSSIAGGSSSSKPVSTSGAPPLKPALVQRPLSAFMGAKGAAAGGGASRLAVGTGSIMRGGPSVFGAGRVRVAPKVSRNPGLPSVMGSPVKGGGGDGDDTMLEEELMMSGIEQNLETKDAATAERVTSPRGVTFDFSGLEGFEPSKKGKEKERLPEAWRQNASRRASMAGQDLSKSVSLPLRPIGLMGPPDTPLDRVGIRSTSSSYPSSSSSDGAEGMRRSTRIAKSTSAADDDEATAATTAEPQQRPAVTPVQPLTILKGCIVFVDIISELGDDSARSFITDMLKNLGARVLGSVGQTCTHIVYKNGLRSTYTRYKALADPKPHVVGMEWVVQSAEKRIHEDETPYLIDMDDMNTTAIKRRKSMLPRLMSGGMPDDDADGDYSFEGSSSSMILDDELGQLAPLERARLRKAGTQGIQQIPLTNTK